jgi:iron complex outermembrane receptor protein
MPVAPDARDVEAHLLPRGGLVVRPLPELSIRANAGMYARPPDFLELFGDQGSVVGNTNLVSERGLGWELGAHAESHWALPVGIGLDVAYARTRVHDLIVFEPNSQQTQHAVNVGEAYVRTVEAGALVCLGTVADATTSVTSTLGRNLVDDPVYANNALPNVPPWEVSQTTRLHVGPWAQLSHTWSYTGATFVDAANHSLRAPRDLHSVALALTPARGLPSIRAEVLNLFDVRGMAVDRNPLSADDDTLVVKPLADFAGYPLPGRTVMVAVAWQEPSQD